MIPGTHLSLFLFGCRCCVVIRRACGDGKLDGGTKWRRASNLSLGAVYRDGAGDVSRSYTVHCTRYLTVFISVCDIEGEAHIVWSVWCHSVHPCFHRRVSLVLVFVHGESSRGREGVLSQHYKGLPA